VTAVRATRLGIAGTIAGVLGLAILLGWLFAWPGQTYQAESGADAAPLVAGCAGFIGLALGLLAARAPGRQRWLWSVAILLNAVVIVLLGFGLYLSAYSGV